MFSSYSQAMAQIESGSVGGYNARTFNVSRAGVIIFLLLNPVITSTTILISLPSFPAPAGYVFFHSASLRLPFFRFLKAF